MKILVEGKLPEQKLYKTMCRKCGTQFSFYAHEARRSYDQRDGDFLSIRCPLPGCTQTETVAV